MVLCPLSISYFKNSVRGGWWMVEGWFSVRYRKIEKKREKVPKVNQNPFFIYKSMEELKINPPPSTIHPPSTIPKYL